MGYIPINFFMEYPFDNKVMGSIGEKALNLFIEAQSYFQSNNNSHQKEEVANELYKFDKVCLEKYGTGLSSKLFIFRKKGNNEISKRFSVKDISNIYGLNNAIEISESKFEGLSIFNQWKEDLSNLKYKVIIYGVNNHSELLNSIVDNSKAEITAYIDYTECNTGKYINNKKIISIREINEYEYDYILLLSYEHESLIKNINNYKIPDNKIFNFSRHYLIDADYNFYRKYYEFIDSSKEYEGFITGLSYAEVGINTSYLEKKFFNFAVSSQDLFFDYEIMKYALSFEKFRKSIKYAIIGISYYSFGYDLSKSQSSTTIRTEIYYPIIENVHNYKNAAGFIQEYEVYRSICRKIFKQDYARVIFNSFKDDGLKVTDEMYKKEFDSTKLTDSEKEALIEEVKRDFDKNYPLTIKENKEILKDYLELLKSSNIKPIIVVCPVVKLYGDNSSEETKKEFYEIINELKLSYNFQLLDYFENPEFKDSDFYDTAHLNYEGAKKFSAILNDNIEW